MKFPFLIFFGALMVGCVQPQPTEQADGSTEPPVITAVKAEPEVIQVGQSCTITCDAVNPAGGELNYSWKASLGDIVGQGNMVRYSAAYCCTGANQITVTASNSGGSDSETVIVTVR
ncbi:MAG: PKD domain-containing protein [bacterium]